MLETEILGWVLPLLLGFVVTILATWLLESRGGIVGGVLATTPHIVVVGTVFILLNIDNQKDALIANYSAIFSIVSNIVYLYCWKYIPLYFENANLCCVFTVSLLMWFICAFIYYIIGSTLLESQNINIYQISATVVTILQVITGIVGNYKYYEAPKGQNKVSWKVHSTYTSYLQYIS